MATVKPYISSRYWDTRGRTSPHKGVDTAFGVYAQGDGVVVAARSDIPNTHTGLGVTYAELGNYIKIQHADGYLTMHAHLNNGSPIVKVGDKVKRGKYYTNHPLSNVLHHLVIKILTPLRIGACVAFFVAFDGWDEVACYCVFRLITNN